MNGNDLRLPFIPVHLSSTLPWQKPRSFLVIEESNERRTLWASAITGIMMVVEIAAGLLTGSMALLADGWHMGTHLAALGVAVFAYRYARTKSQDLNFAFGTGKVAVLGGFASAVALAVIGLMMIFESAVRLFSPHAIQYHQALIVAGIGLAVNLACAVVLGGHSHHHSHPEDNDHEHDHSDAHSHNHSHGQSHRDHNIQAAYAHVLADALTSVLAIGALLAALFLGWLWVDAAVGIVGGLVVGLWAWSLIRDTSYILLDRSAEPELADQIRQRIESEEDNRVADLRVWPVGPGVFAVIVSLVATSPRPPAHYSDMLRIFPQIVYVTIEAHPCTLNGPVHTCCPPNPDAEHSHL